MATENEILELALETGFDLAGLTPLRPPRAAERFEAWLAAGHHADMDWLERERERILDPRRILPEGKSLLVVGLGHARAPIALEGGGRVARYAAGRDYHNRMTKLLRKLRRRLVERGVLGASRIVVDAGPLLERSHAAEAGLGFESRAANLLHPRFGPWFFLGELFLDLEVESTAAPPAGSCGTCTACLDACPTGAIRSPGVVDAGACLSYQTIENRGSVPRELRPLASDWVFGCDVCSEVCPWGREAPDSAADWGTHPAVERSLVDWLRTPAERFAQDFRGSPLQRPRRAGLARNAALGLAGAPSEEGRDALREALRADPAPAVRETAAWSLIHVHAADAGVRAEVLRAAAHDPDPEVQSEIERTLKEAHD